MSIKDIENRLNKAYDTYINIVCPMIMQLEDLTSSFPVAILNEIRAFTTHISKINLSDDITIKEDNLIKAERHVKRMLLDCYKYMCIGYDDKYKEYQNLYKNVDLSVIDNGDFLKKVVSDKQIVSNKIHKARLEELSLENNEENTFQNYEDAYNIYCELIRYIEDHNSLLDKAKHKYTTKTIVSYIFGVIGILGTIFTVISLFLQIFGQQ